MPFNASNESVQYALIVFIEIKMALLKLRKLVSSIVLYFCAKSIKN